MEPESGGGSKGDPSSAYILQRLAMATTRPAASISASPPVATATTVTDQPPVTVPGQVPPPGPVAHSAPVAALPSAVPDAANPATTVPAPGPVATGEPSILVARRTRMVPIATFDVPAVIRPIAPPDGWTDVLTGADGPRLWDRIVLSEEARVSRYHRPVTVAFAEIVGMDRVAGLWGWDVAGRALASCARRLGREIRSSDHIARLEQARFGILLTETSEIAAINFVERARSSCERELKAIGREVTIGFGWASPPAGGDLSDAVGLALTRLAAELAAEASPASAPEGSAAENVDTAH